MAPEVQTYRLGDFELQEGGVLKDGFIAYKAFGEPSNPLIIYPTWYSGKIADNEWLIGPDKTLNPSKYFILIVALFGNGESTSPSNTPSPRPFPNITFYDNVRAQHQLVTQHFKLDHAHAVVGWSMGAGQTYQWATQYPDFMTRIVPFCGAARTSEHNRAMLEGVKSALLAAKGIPSAGVRNGETSSGDYVAWTEETKTTGLKALARVYSGWGFSQAFYRQQLYRTFPTLGFKDLEDFMVNFWEAWALSKDPEDMLTMLWTWQAGDVGNQEGYGWSLERALQGIKAKALVLPSQTDLYFPPEDSEYEVKNMRPGIGLMLPFPSVWGHWAGGPGQSTEDVAWLDSKLKWFLDSE